MEVGQVMQEGSG